MQKYIRNQLEKVTFLERGCTNGVNFEIVMYLWREKDPVYYAFIEGSQTRAILNSLNFVTLQDALFWKLTNEIIDTKEIYPVIIKQKTSPNFTLLKLLKILR